MNPALEEIAEIHRVLETAVEDLLCLSEHGAALARAEAPDLLAMEQAFVGVMQVCAFQDLTGQRLDRLAGLLEGRIETRAEAALLNGPTRSGVDQVAADRLMQAG